jgi:surfactin synthase thioesterase subunit
MAQVGPGKRTLTPEPRPNAVLRLVCFHHSGGGAYGFRDWPRRLRQDVEVIAVQLPGRENRFTEPLQHDPHALLDDLMATLADAVGKRYALFGHSLGGALAYLLARRVALSRELPAPMRLFVSSSRAPGRKPRPSSQPQRLSDAALVERITSLGGTPQELLDNAELLEAVLPILRADFGLLDALEALEPEPLQIPITVLRGARDKAVSDEDVEVWRELTLARSEVHTLPGGHFYFQTSAAAAFNIINSTLSRDLQFGSLAGG